MADMAPFALLELEEHVRILPGAVGAMTTLALHRHLGLCGVLDEDELFDILADFQEHGLISYNDDGMWSL